MDPAETSPRVSQLSQNLVRLEQEADARRRELEAEIAKAQEIQRRLSGLQRAVDDASDQLTNAESQFASYKAAANQLREGLLTVWGLSHVDGSVYRAPDYSALPGIEAAIADFPRIRASLQDRLANAQTALSEFERQNDL